MGVALYIDTRMSCGARRLSVPVAPQVTADHRCTASRARTFPLVAAVLEGALRWKAGGFAIVERLSFERYTRDEAQMVYWVIGQLLGVPFAQDVKGTLLYDVKDTGQDPTKGARFS